MQINHSNLFPKHPLPGSVHIEWKRCGRPWCRCSTGAHLHGPYFYRRWRENGRQKKRYVPIDRLREVLLAIEMWNQETNPICAITKSLKQVDAF